jgi:hypothetical protein
MPCIARALSAAYALMDARSVSAGRLSVERECPLLAQTAKEYRVAVVLSLRWTSRTDAMRRVLAARMLFLLVVFRGSALCWSDDIYLWS